MLFRRRISLVSAGSQHAESNATIFRYAAKADENTFFYPVFKTCNRVNYFDGYFWRRHICVELLFLKCTEYTQNPWKWSSQLVICLSSKNGFQIRDQLVFRSPIHHLFLCKHVIFKVGNIIFKTNFLMFSVGISTTLSICLESKYRWRGSSIVSQITNTRHFSYPIQIITFSAHNESIVSWDSVEHPSLAPFWDTGVLSPSRKFGFWCLGSHQSWD